MNWKTLVISLWFIGVSLGLHALMKYSSAEGRVAEVASAWPQEIKLLKGDSKHLVLFIHPGCSCSSASLSEFSRLMSQEMAEELTAEIVFMKTPKLENLFEENPLIKKASLVARTKISFDESGEEAKRFGAETSGMSYLYGDSGELLFSGGLTMARGHEGRSAGVAAIEEQLKNTSSNISRKVALVFGCDIFEEVYFKTWM